MKNEGLDQDQDILSCSFKIFTYGTMLLDLKLGQFLLCYGLHSDFWNSFFCSALQQFNTCSKLNGEKW